MATATKKKKAEQATKTVRLGFVIDESGSMGHLKRTVIDGFNEFIGTLQGEDNAPNVYSTCGLFDASGNEPKVRFKHIGVPLPEVQPFGLYDYSPRGSTPLRDALGEVIGKLDGQTQEGERVMVVVMTDGQENASTEVTPQALRNLVQDREKAGWEFIYMGANVDAFSEAQSIGMVAKPGSYVNFAPSARGASNTFRTAGMRGQTYTTADADVAKASYLASSEATPTSVAEDPAEFAAQEKLLKDAQDKAKAEAEQRFEAAKAKHNSAVEAARNIMRGGPDA